VLLIGLALLGTGVVRLVITSAAHNAAWAQGAPHGGWHR